MPPRGQVSHRSVDRNSSTMNHSSPLQRQRGVLIITTGPVHSATDTLLSYPWLKLYITYNMLVLMYTESGLRLSFVVVEGET